MKLTAEIVAELTAKACDPEFLAGYRDIIHNRAGAPIPIYHGDLSVSGSFPRYAMEIRWYIREFTSDLLYVTVNVMYPITSKYEIAAELEFDVSSILDISDLYSKLVAKIGVTMFGYLDSPGYIDPRPAGYPMPSNGRFAPMPPIWAPPPSSQRDPWLNGQLYKNNMGHGQPDRDYTNIWAPNYPEYPRQPFPSVNPNQFFVINNGVNVNNSVRDIPIYVDNEPIVNLYFQAKKQIFRLGYPKSGESLKEDPKTISRTFLGVIKDTNLSGYADRVVKELSHDRDLSGVCFARVVESAVPGHIFEIMTALDAKGTSWDRQFISLNEFSAGEDGSNGGAPGVSPYATWATLVTRSVVNLVIDNHPSIQVEDPIRISTMDPVINGRPNTRWLKHYRNNYAVYQSRRGGPIEVVALPEPGGNVIRIIRAPESIRSPDSDTSTKEEFNGQNYRTPEVNGGKKNDPIPPGATLSSEMTRDGDHISFRSATEILDRISTLLTSISDTGRRTGKKHLHDNTLRYLRESVLAPLVCNAIGEKEAYYRIAKAEEIVRTSPLIVAGMNDSETSLTTNDQSSTQETSLKEINMTHHYEVAKVLLQLAEHSNAAIPEEYGISTELPDSVKATLSEEIQAEKAEVEKMAAVTVKGVLDKETLETKKQIENIELLKKNIEERKEDIKKTQRARAYGIQTGNYLPLHFLLTGIRDRDADLGLYEIPTSFRVPAVRRRTTKSS